MTTTRSTRKRRRPTPAAYWDDDLVNLDPDSPFTKKVRELRAFIAGLGRPVEEWTEADRVEFLRRSDNNSLAVAAALATPGLTTATSENPHRPHDDDAPSRT
ncbi:MAG: hypothetical protein ACRDJE_21055 [Dehalococcoidia bacterium]